MVILGVALLSQVDWRNLKLGRGEIETLIASVIFTAQILWLERLVFVRADHMRWLDHSYQLFQACVAHDPHEAERVAQDAMRWTLLQATTLLEDHLASVGK